MKSFLIFLLGNWQTFIKEEVDQEEQDCFYEDTTTLELPVTNEAENIFVGYDMTDTTQNEDNSHLVNGSEHDNVTTLLSAIMHLWNRDLLRIYVYNLKSLASSKLLLAIALIIRTNLNAYAKLEIIMS